MLNKKRLNSSYPDDVKHASALVAFNPDKLIYYGSASKKSMYLSSGDIDLVEPIHIPSEAHKLAIHIQTIIKNILKTPNCYLGDFKSGSNPYYDIDIGTIKHGKIVGFNKQKVKDFIESRNFDNSLEKKKILSLFNNTIMFKQWNEINNYLHDYQTLRWNQQELLNGYKMVNGQKVYLQDTIQDKKALTKIDTIQFVPSLNRWIEITNYFDVVNNGKEFNSSKYVETLKINMLKYYFDKNWFKFSKRLLAYSLFKKDKALSNKLFSIVHSGLGIMYQQYSELKAIEYLIKHYHLPISKFYPQLQAMKMRLGNVYEFEFNEKYLDKLLDKGDIEAVVEHLYKCFNDYTYKQLNKLHILPYKADYLP